MYRVGSKLQFSPRDLINFLEGDFASWMDRLYLEQRTGALDCLKIDTNSLPQVLRPDEEDEQAQLLARKGQEHEQKFLEELRRQGFQIAVIEQDDLAPANTVAAMKTGVPVIYQACLQDDLFQGYADFLFRSEGGSDLGDFHYEPSDTKLAGSAKPYFIIQLCAYAQMLETMQGRRPRNIEFILGTGLKQQFKTDSFFYYYLHLRRAFLQFQQDFDPCIMPNPGFERSFGRWSTVAARLLEESDHLSRVARITRGQIKRLENAGITTMKALPTTTQSNIQGVQPAVFERLKIQAVLQIASRHLPTPKFQIIIPQSDDPRRGLAILPPPSRLDVFFDIEGFPLVEGGLEYLLGVVSTDQGQAEFTDWWAHDNLQEKASFEAFIDWVHKRWEEDPSMHIYHYAPYETSAMRRLMGKYGTRETEVDDLLRNQVFIDLYTVVRQGLVVGTPSYSLKDVEKLYMPPRTGEVQTALGSVVAYQRWLDSGEGLSWQESAILAEIRNYNRIDCESLLRLRDWLLEVQKENKIHYVPESSAEPIEKEGDKKAVTPSKLLSEDLLQQIEEGKVQNSERSRVQELFAWLLEFHWREAKPVFWRMFDRNEMTEEELIDDFDCIGGLRKISKTPRQEKRSWVYSYEFDPDQDTKLHDDCKCFFAHDLSLRTTIVSCDQMNGLLEIKLGPKAPVPPERLCLIPDEYVSATQISDAIYRYVEAWSKGQILSTAVDDLIYRKLPRVRNHSGGPLVDEQKELLPQVIDLIIRLDQSTLCIQGPPGTGKTYTAAAAVAELLRQGLRVGITANSHKAILNIMQAIVTAIERSGIAARLVKVGDHCNDPLVISRKIKHLESGGGALEALGSGPLVLGGTAWVFSRPELQQRFDYLFVDEAGQFSLANLVATGISAKNMVLVGDQMQLSQPIQGSHPGESGKSGLDYLLDGHQTIPPDFGIFLNQTRRMHPEICHFISQAVYEGRLHSHPATANQRVALPTEPKIITRENGVVFVPVSHEGNSQSCDEEIEVIESIVCDLMGRQVLAADGNQHPLSREDVLFVAPYNMQVRKLQQRFGSSARVGSVDKFQGQEAPVVIVSMCASSLDDCPRGAEFLLDPNRINVAISRAKSLAIVVGSPGIMSARCTTVEQMKLVNLYCWLAAYAGDPLR